jgi:DNA modification methylase
MQIVEKKVTELKAYEKNPRKNEKAVAPVAESIKEFGFKVPIIIDSDGVIIAGHTRVSAAKKLGMKSVPCIVADDLTPEQIKAFRVADNSTAQIAEWDLSLLKDELMDLDFDMSLFGLEKEIKDIERIFAPEIIEDDVPEVDEKNIITKLGDIWQLGRHRLMCGDSTDALNYKHLLQGVKVDLVFTDPPYGMKKETDGVLNDNLNYDKLLEFNKQWIPLTFDALKDNGSWYCWGIDEPLMDIYSNILKPMMRENKITFRNLITWDKGNCQGQMSEKHNSYAVASEKCLFVACGKTVLHINSWQKKFDERFRPLLRYLQQQKKLCGWDTAQLKTIAGCKGLVADHWTTTDQWRVPPEDVYKKWQYWAKENNIKAFLKSHKELLEEQEKIKKEYEKERTYFDNTHDNFNDVWHFDRTNNDERELTGGHATPKPIALCSRAIKSSSRENETVLDVFGGSGSTLIACEQLNRICYMMELDPKYVQVIIQRYIAFKGTSDDVYRINADGTKTKYEDIKRWETLTGEKAVKI